MILRENRTAQRLRRTAFTLMEMLVVVAIIVALAGMGGFFFMARLNDAKKDTAKIQCKVLAEAIEQYQISNRDAGMPTLQQLKEGASPILKKDANIIDPWGQPYVIETVQGTGQINVYSNGPPGEGKPINKLN